MILGPLIVSYCTWKYFFSETIYVGGNDFQTFHAIEYERISEILAEEWQMVFVVILFIWGLGTFLFGICRCISEILFLAKLEKLSRLENDIRTLDMNEKLKLEEKIKQDVQIYRSSVIISPFIIGVMNAKIFLPNRKFSDIQEKLILSHELKHLRRKDYFFRRILSALCALYWFNPAIYRFAELFVDVNEMACDESVLERKTKAEKLIYAKMFLEISEKNENKKSNKALYLIGNPQVSFERRIRNMFRKNAMKRTSYTILTACVMFFCPLTAFATTTGVMQMQNMAVEEAGMEEVGQDDTFQELFEYEIDIESDKLNSIPLDLGQIVHGGVDIDLNLKKGVGYRSDPFELKKDDEVQVYLNADESTDKFKVGISGVGGRYVNSKDGSITHTFTIKNKGKYTIYVKSRSREEIHVTGYIYVNN